MASIHKLPAEKVNLHGAEYQVRSQKLTLQQAIPLFQEAEKMNPSTSTSANPPVANLADISNNNRDRDGYRGRGCGSDHGRGRGRISKIWIIDEETKEEDIQGCFINAARTSATTVEVTIVMPIGEILTKMAIIFM